MQIPFKSSIFDLPISIRTELEQMIDKSTSGLGIYNRLKEKYGSQTQVPTVPTILRYVKYYNGKKETLQKKVIEEKLTCNFESGLQEIEGVLTQIQQGGDPSFNKVRLLEGLVAKCLQRINDLECDQPSGKGKKKDPRIEQAIARYISEAKSIVESVTKLSGDVQKDEQILIQLIRKETQEILALVKDIILDVCPEKYNVFRDKLKLRLQDKGKEISSREGAIEAEVIPSTLPELDATPVVQVNWLEFPNGIEAEPDDPIIELVENHTTNI